VPGSGIPIIYNCMGEALLLIGSPFGLEAEPNTIALGKLVFGLRETLI
jgi:hypothetical protein